MLHIFIVTQVHINILTIVLIQSAEGGFGARNNDHSLAANTSHHTARLATDHSYYTSHALNI